MINQGVRGLRIPLDLALPVLALTAATLVAGQTPASVAGIEPEIPIALLADLRESPAVAVELVALLKRFDAREHRKAPSEQVVFEARQLTAFVRRHTTARCALMAKALLGRSAVRTKVQGCRESGIRCLDTIVREYGGTMGACLARLWLAQEHLNEASVQLATERTHANAERVRSAMTRHRDTLRAILPVAEKIATDTSELMAVVLMREERCEPDSFARGVKLSLAAQVYELGNVQGARTLLHSYVDAPGDKTLQWLAREELKQIDVWEEHPVHLRPYNLYKMGIREEPEAKNKGNQEEEEKQGLQQ